MGEREGGRVDEEKWEERGSERGEELMKRDE